MQSSEESEEAALRVPLVKRAFSPLSFVLSSSSCLSVLSFSVVACYEVASLSRVVNCLCACACACAHVCVCVLCG